MDQALRLEQLVADAFQAAGYRVRAESAQAGRRIDLVVRRQGQPPIYVEIKAAPEGRSDRLIPLFAKAVLQVKAHAAKLGKDAHLVAVVGAPSISSKAAQAVMKFAQEYAPDVAAGVVDLEGLRLFAGHDLEALNAVSSQSPRKAVAPQALNLFSDLNQWMLKLLLARHLNRRELMGGPIAQYKNASELAAHDAANVSVMSAFRFLEQLQQEGFLHESSPVIQLVRVRELLRRWQAVYQRPVRELPVRWLLPSGSLAQVSNTVKAYGERSCSALFAAAHAHGFRHVTGVPIHLYVDNLAESGLQRMGVVVAHAGETPDLILRIPHAKESVFRAMVMVGRGYRAADILQVWLDVASYPSRGQEQADLIYGKVIEPMLVGL